MPLFESDAYAMLTRVIDPARPATFIDVGANVGDVSRRLVREFPYATVHAFEPTPDVFETLVEHTRDLDGVRRHQLAVGNAVEPVPFIVTKNRWCSSVLPPTDRGHTYYGDWYDHERTIEVDMVRLDDWARAEGVNEVDAIKIDVQGLELEVLRGADRLLRDSVRAVYCEAQLVPDYVGACSFSEIDLHLRDCGFLIHQIHDVFVRGPELQSSYLDGLWLKETVLEELRRRPATPSSVPLHGGLAACRARGLSRIAIYGAGEHTRRMGNLLMEPPVTVDCIIDDDPARQNRSLWGYPVVSRDAARARDIGGVLLSSEQCEADLWNRSAVFREDGIEVVRIYGASVHEKIDRVRAAMRACAGDRRRRIALYGAGAHTRCLEPVLRNPPVEVVAIIDDRPAPDEPTLFDRPVMTIDAAGALGLDAVIISSDRHESDMWARTGAMRDAGIAVHRLYHTTRAS